ncbi:MAG: hypothetical protein CMH55_00300 [Myxococcales bacterium]|nr:hypothetical protein [Myxococcales bacterium]|tara:strand:- start:1179 stop:1823 length:645 start_codon:yes stop_codon:yes gene_type:complete
MENPVAAVQPRTDGRQRILKKATELFAQAGYEGTSLSQIATAAGMRKPSLLYHFDSKEALRKEVLAEFFTHWRELLPSVLAQTRGGEDRFTVLMEACVNFLTEDPNRARLFVREAMDNPEAFSAEMTEQLTPWLALVARAIEEGQRSGVVRKEVNAEAFILQMVRLAMTHFAMTGVISAFMPTTDQPTDRSLEELLRIGQVALFSPHEEASKNG